MAGTIAHYNPVLSTLQVFTILILTTTLLDWYSFTNKKWGTDMLRNFTKAIELVGSGGRI